jgi:hypothetical protein
LKQGDTVYTIAQVSNVDPREGERKTIEAGEVGYIVGWRGLDSAVVRLHGADVAVVPTNTLRVSRHRRKR